MNLARQGMIVAFRFFYTNKNSFLAYFLDYYAKKSTLKYTINKNDDEITLFIEGSEEELLKFSDEYMNLVPNSVFLAKSSVEVVKETLKTNLQIPQTKFANITPAVIKNYISKAEILPNEYDIISEISVLKDGEFIGITSENFDELVEFCFLNLLHNQTLNLKNKNGYFILKSGFDFKYCDFVMPTSLPALPKAFIADEKSLIALASFEKPVINLKTSAIFRQNHKEAPLFFDVKAASDFFTFALFDRLSKEELFFVSVKIEKSDFLPLKISVSENNFIVINHGEFISQSEAKFLEEKEFSNFALFGLICNEFSIIEQKNVNIFFDRSLSDSIKVYDKNSAVELLKLPKFSSFEELKDEILSDEVGRTLFENFQKEFGFPTGDIKSSSFYSLFDIVSQILFGKNAKYLLDNAKDFLGTKGPRLDFLLKDTNEFDLAKFVRSGMSYKLAGVSDKIISYGYIESLVYFISDFLDDLKDDANIDNVIFTGTLFEEKDILNLMEKIISKQLNAKFSNYLGLEAR